MRKLERILFIRYYSCVYFHILSLDGAGKKLTGTQAGTFLITPSKGNPGTYSLSINDGATIKHYSIRSLYTKDHKYYIVRGTMFDSLHKLVHYHMLQAGSLCYALTVPVTKPVSIPTTKDEGWEISVRPSIKLSKCLTAGEFGETWKSYWNIIKTNIATDISQEAFLNEANILKKLHHDNIIQLYGVYTKEYPFYIVTESMENGDLNEYLKTERGSHLTSLELTDIAVQVLNGMIYLGEQDYIHCDLKAENVLVGEHSIIKIANFHLARHLNGNEYCSVEEGTHFATRWTAPEGYTSKQMSIKSDVWSFGVLLWELVTKGREPYPDMTDEQVLEAVPQGYHMSEPKDCPEPFYQIMLDCWRLDDDERPIFDNIHRHLLWETV